MHIGHASVRPSRLGSTDFSNRLAPEKNPIRERSTSANHACELNVAASGTVGCPHAKGASGNVASEDVVYMLEGMGIATGIDLPKLIETGQWLAAQLGRETGSKVGKAAA
jgi:hypothetical protein